MVTVALIAAVVALVLGLLLKWLLDRIGSKDRYHDSYYRIAAKKEITWREYAVVAIVLVAVLIPTVVTIGNKLGVAEVLRYEQTVNGVNTAALDTVVSCVPGHPGNDALAGRSNCAYSYVSGRYSWQEPHTFTTCTSDSKGNQSCTTTTTYTTEWADIYTPYARQEHYYSITSSMGAGGAPDPYVFATAYVGDERYLPNVAIPPTAPRGAPAEWLDAKAHIEAGDPLPVTMMTSYDNYILASKDPMLATYAAKIEDYKKAQLLPDFVANIKTNPMKGRYNLDADKVSFVGVSVPDRDAWQRAVMRYNAALGMKLQGDLVVVLVDSKLVPKDDALPYVAALKSYWTSDSFGKRALAKNAFVLVMGVDNNSTVAWAESTTGMPTGNEDTATWIRNELPGKALDPKVILGSPRTVIKPGVSPDKFTKEDVTVTLSTPRGVVEEIMFEKAPFKRARMSCNDNTCVGFKDLVTKIEPTITQKIWTGVVANLVALACWLFVAFTAVLDNAVLAVAALWKGEPAARKTRSRMYNDTYWRY